MSKGPATGEGGTTDSATAAGPAAAPPAAPGLRTEIDTALAAAQWPRARALLLQLWEAGPTPAVAPFVVSRFEKLRGHVPLTPCKLAILRSFTVEPIVPLARAEAFCGGIDLDVRLGDFNTISQDVLEPGSWLYAWSPGVTLVAAQARDLSPALWEAFADLSAEQVEAEIARCVEHYRSLLQAIRGRSSTQVIVHNWQLPPSPARGVLDANSIPSQAGAIARVNTELAEVCGQARNVYVLDYAAIVARHGAARWEDARKWLMVRLPVAADYLLPMAREWLRFLHPATGRVCKCLVTDLDHTLWGGVIGEDGPDGIKLDRGTAGAGFRGLQRAMLDLYRRGILLAVASKNNPPEARDAIEKHPEMLLRLRHFAALRINWTDKATSLREIAAELNIGLDALAFVDDNPVERAWVREQLPEVTVIDLPADPMGYAEALRRSPVFERLVTTDEDLARGRMYVEQRIRNDLQASAGSLEDFYRSLEMKVEIARVTPATLARVAQLTQKTNQFNLTTRRYTEQQVTDLAADPAWVVYSLVVKDRMGDNGLVGVAITRDDAASSHCDIDTLLLSCRVIGRTVETAFLATIATDAKTRGMRSLGGWYLPTKKNAPASQFYATHGFTLAEQAKTGSLWRLDLARDGVTCPPWIEVKVG